MTARRILPVIILLVLAVAAISLSGCGSENGVSEEEHARIQKGMTLDEVQAITGSPTRTHRTGSSQNPNIIWYFDKADGEGLIRVSFLDGRVDSVSPYDTSVEPLE